MKIINASASVFYEKYKPNCIDDLIIPQEIKLKIKKYVQLEDMPNIGLFSNLPGCLLPGTRVSVQSEPNWVGKSEMVVLKSLTNKHQWNFLVKHCTSKKLDNNMLVDLNSVTSYILKVAKGSQSLKKQHNESSKYNDKHLKLEYWLYKLSPDKALKKLKTLRKYKEYFDFDRDVFVQKGFKEENLEETILKIKFKMIYTEFDFLKEIFPYLDKRVTTDFWELRGYSATESKAIVSAIQTKIQKIKLDTYSPEMYRESSPRCKEYWIKNGYSALEATEKVSIAQSTFSLEKCISQLGVSLGTARWQTRQDKWQTTMTSKSKEEIHEINYKRSFQRLMERGTPGMVYYIRFFNEETEFWKIGITKRTIQKRFGSIHYVKEKYNLEYEILLTEEMDMVDCFDKEQKILSDHIENRVIINYNGFKTTEAFKGNILEQL